MSLVSSRSAAPRLGVEWVDALRDSAWAIYTDRPLPERTSHLWRYTAPEEFRPPVEALEKRSAGVSIETESPARAADVTISPLVAAARDREELVRPYWGSLVPPDFGMAEALNAAAWSDGLFLHVSDGARVDAPIRLRTAIDNGTRFFAQRHLVLVEKGASVTIVEDLFGEDSEDDAAFNSVTELFAAPGARVRYLMVQRSGRRTVSHRTVRSRLARDAELDLRVLSMGGGLDKADIGVILAGEGATSRMKGFYYGDGQRRADHHTVHDHVGTRTFSDIDFRVVLSDRSHSAYTGLIRIAENARGCEAFQENRNLLLSEDSRADSIPELEILNDEVACKHGATMGPIDPEQLFYLAARGLDRVSATRRIVAGTLDAALEGLSPVIRQPIDDELDRRLKEVTSR